jgi:hypothetical protein
MIYNGYKIYRKYEMIVGDVMTMGEKIKRARLMKDMTQ